MCIERFSFECQKVIGVAFLRDMIGLKNSRHFFIQSEVNQYNRHCLSLNREGLGTSLKSMGLATIDPHSHKV